MGKNMILKYTIICLVWTCLIAQSAAAADANLLFRSGFEGTVQIVPWSPQYHNNRHTIAGFDLNNSWPDDVPGDGTYHNFYYAVADGNDYSEYVNTDIVTVNGRQDKPTRALYQAVMRDDGDDPALSRNQYNMYPSSTNNFDQMYVKYWIKFQPDLDTIMPENSWRMMMEWYESGDDYVFNLMVIKTAGDGKMKWKLTGRIVKPTSEYDWVEINDQVQVPVGEWFLLEVFWKHSSDPDGQVFVKVNHEEVFNHMGRNRLNSGILAYSPFKCYGRTGYYQWIDEFEVWDNLPEIKTLQPPENPRVVIISQ